MAFSIQSLKTPEHQSELINNLEIFPFKGAISFPFSSLEEESIIVTLIIDDGGSPEVLNNLVGYMTEILEENIPMVSLLSATVDRFGKSDIGLHYSF